MKNKKNQDKSENNLLYDLHDTPHLGKWIILAVQHVFAMFGATILVPIIVNGAVGEEIIPVSVTLAASGIGTLIYIISTKQKSPVYLGSSFAFISPMIAGYFVAGAAGVYTALIAVGLLYVIIAILIKLLGKNWIDRILPPIIVGPMIMIIGLGLSVVAIDSIGINAAAVEAGGIDWPALIVALVTFLVTVIVAIYSKGFLKVIPFLIGIIVGYITAIYFGMIDFSAFNEVKFFAWPDFKFIFKDWSLDFRALLTIVPVALVTICEHIGDHKVLGTIINKDLLKDPGLDRTLIGDGIATAASAMIGGPANTTYGENTAVVGMSKVASIKVIILAALFAIGIAFLGKLAFILGSIPAPVLGGVSVILYGFISVNGLKVLIQNQVDFNKTRNVIISATMLVIGLGGAIITFASKDFSLEISGMSLAALVGVMLNLLLPEEK